MDFFKNQKAIVIFVALSFLLLIIGVAPINVIFISDLFIAIRHSMYVIMTFISLGSVIFTILQMISLKVQREEFERDKDELTLGVKKSFYFLDEMRTLYDGLETEVFGTSDLEYEVFQNQTMTHEQKNQELKNLYQRRQNHRQFIKKNKEDTIRTMNHYKGKVEHIYLKYANRDLQK